MELKYRVDGDGENPLSSVQNETYAGGTEVGNWNSLPMSASDVQPPGNILPATVRAPRYGAMITGQEDVLIDYYVEAVDLNGNITRSDIQHVYVGQGSETGGLRVEIAPDPAVAGDPVTVTYDAAGGPIAGAGQVQLHYGFNNWDIVEQDVPMTWDAGSNLWNVTVQVPSTATQFDLVFNDGNGIWDNNNGQDWHFTVTGGMNNDPDFVIDGTLDAAATTAASNGSMDLFVGAGRRAPVSGHQRRRRRE